MPEIKGDYQGKLKTIKATADAKLETVSIIEGGTVNIGDIERIGTIGDVDHLGTVGRLETIGMIESGTISEVTHVGTIGDIEHLGSIANTKFNQGSLDDHDRWIKGDDGGTKRYVKVDGDGKLQTVSALEAGTAVIGDIDRVATVGRIDNLGSIANTEFDIGRVGTIGDIEHLGSIANTSFDQGSVSDHKREMYMRQLGTWIPVEGEDENLKTVSVLKHGTASIGDVNTVSTVEHVDSLGTVERVKDIDNVGTIGRLETIGMIEAGTISEVGRVGTVGDIEHLGSIANTKFNQGSLDDHDRWIKGDDGGTKRYVKVDGDGKLQTVSLLEAGTSVIGDLNRVATVGQIDHLGSIANVSFDQGSVTDHKRRMYMNEYGTWAPLQGTYGRLKAVSVLEASTAVIGDVRRVGTVGVIDHLGSIANTEFDIGRVGTIGDIEHLGSIANTEFDQGAISDPIRRMYAYDYNALDYCSLTLWGGGLITKPGFDGTVWRNLSVNPQNELILATLGTVERVKDIDNVGTVGKLETIGMIEAGTISEVGHLGTIGDINHLGSIGNTSFDQGSVSDHKREMYGWDESDWEKVRTDTGGKLKTAPATTRKGGVQTVNNKGTAVALIGTHTPCIGVIVQADYENLGTVFVGDSAVDDTHGFKLRRDKFISFSADDVNDVYIDASRGTQSVSFLYINY